MLGIGKIRKVEGTIAQLSQSELSSGSMFYNFVTIDGDDGTAYRVKRLTGTADVSHELHVGNHVALHILPIRHIFNAFTTRSIILATEGDRGVSMAVRLSQQIGALIGMTLFWGMASLIWTFIVGGTALFRYSGPYGGDAFSAIMGFLLWMTPVWLIIHFLVCLVAIIVKSNMLKARLLGTLSGGAVGSQVMADGRILKEI